MLRERWERVLDTFDRVKDAVPAERGALLQDLCRDDAELRAEVESLLRRHDRLDEGFLQPPPPPPMSIASSARLEAEDAAEPDALVGQSIDGFRIEEVIDQGGMGSVYLAEQEQPRRKVAIKVLHAGLLSSSVRRRFEYESEYLARLQHPHVAQVFQIGEHAGRPYIVMEYVPGGRSITDYCDEHDLSVKQRLEVFCQACEAVQYAHGRSIIHRDLKPANILVDDAGQVKVIDFGVARATNADIALTTMHTETGHLVGTLQYMSPEQCAADPHDIDVQTDVYSLGVILYELLCRRLPYDVGRTPIPSAARMVCETEPPRAGTVDRRLRGDLEHVLQTALEKDRRRRYSSVSDLLRDVRHHLAREPIEATKPTLWTRVIRWVLAHPRMTTLIAAVLVGGSAGAAGVITSYYYVVRFQLNQPDMLEVAPDRTKARLRALSGAILHEWRASGDVPFGLAKLLRPRGTDSQLVLLNGAEIPGAPHSGDLTTFDVAVSYSRPIWQNGVQQDEVPLELQRLDDVNRRTFSAAHAWPIDVFADTPEDEIVSVFSNIYSQRAIRVLTVDEGEILFEAWHNGSLTECHWLSQPRVLVFLGENGLGHVGKQSYVVLGLRPERSVRDERWLNAAEPQSLPSLAWYKTLIVAPDYRITELSLDGSHTSPTSVCVLRIGVTRLSDGLVGTIGRELNRHGLSTTVLGDDWKRNNLPAPDTVIPLVPGAIFADGLAND